MPSVKRCKMNSTRGENYMTTVTVDKRLITPSKIICIGRNYVKHIRELGNELPDQMVVFLKPNSAISVELKSSHQGPLQYESELSFLYEKGKFSAVGFGLDLTKRDLQSRLKERGLPWERAKAFDGSAIFSNFKKIPEITPSLTLELKIDSKIVQTGNVGSMIYKPEQILSELSTFITLQDGDIVMTGTPEGVGVINPNQLFTGTIRDRGQTVVSGEWLAD